MRSIPHRIQYWSRWLLGIERFVQLILGGGLGLVAGLWIVELMPRDSGIWLLGILLAFLGAIAILAGIASELNY